MKIHKEGILSIFIVSIFNALFIAGLFALFPKFTLIHAVLLLGVLFLEFLIIQFFMYSDKILENQNSKVVSPAEGKIVVIEEIEETEFFKEKMIQVSIFMSIWDMHVNRVPINGKVIHKVYYQGKHLLARNPKSSSLNERNSLVFETNSGKKIMTRQIAGIVARRIVNYINIGQTVKQGQQMGFIKFGSRVDIILPRSATINVKLGQKVKCGNTIIAEL